MGIAALVIAVVVAAYSIYMMGKMTLPDAIRAKDSEFQFPTVSNSRDIPVVFGTCKLADPNILNYGNIYSTEIKKRYRAGLRHKTQVIGYKYYATQEVALCWGEIDSIERIEIGDFVALNQPITASSNNVISINKQKLFGEDGVNLGISPYLGNGTPYYFNQQQIPTPNPPSNLNFLELAAWWRNYHNKVRLLQASYNHYKKIYQGAERPHNKGVARLLCWGYVGNTTNIRPMRFVVKRIPKPLNVLHADINGDANPAFVIYEALTNDLWGAGLSNVDSESFRQAAETLFNEKNGISLIWRGEMDVDKFVTHVCDQINAIYYTDLETGQLKLKLIRDDFDVTTIPEVNDDTIVKFKSMKRADSSSIASEMKVKYISRSNNYKENIATAVNSSSQKYLGRIVSVTKEYHGISNAKLALEIANRDLSIISMSPAEIEVSALINRAFAVGSVVRLSYSRHGIKNLICRIKAINWGTLEDNDVTLKLVEDVFRFREAQFSSVPDTNWTPPDTTTNPISQAEAIPVGAYFTNYPAVILLPDLNGNLGFSVYESLSGASDDGSFYQEISESMTVPETGVITSDLDKVTDSFSVSTEYLSITADGNQIRAGANLAVLYDSQGNHEFIAFKGITGASGARDLTGVYRGLLDTPPRDWSTASKILFLDNVQIADFQSNTNLDRHYRFVGRSWMGEGEFTDSTDIPLSLSDDYKKPLYSPVLWGSDFYPDTIDSALTITWHHRSRTDQVTLPTDASEPITSEVYEWELLGDGVKLAGENNSTADHVDVTADMVTNHHQIRFTLKTKRGGLESPLYDHVVTTSSSGGGQGGSGAAAPFDARYLGSATLVAGDNFTIEGSVAWGQARVEGAIIKPTVIVFQTADAKGYDDLDPFTFSVTDDSFHGNSDMYGGQGTITCNLSLRNIRVQNGQHDIHLTDTDDQLFADYFVCVYHPAHGVAFGSIPHGQQGGDIHWFGGVTAINDYAHFINAGLTAPIYFAAGRYGKTVKILTGSELNSFATAYLSNAPSDMSIGHYL